MEFLKRKYSRKSHPANPGDCIAYNEAKEHSYQNISHLVQTGQYLRELSTLRTERDCAATLTFELIPRSPSQSSNIFPGPCDSGYCSY